MENHWRKFFGVMLILVLALGFVPLQKAFAAPISILADTVWDTDQFVDRDVVIEAGATLTIDPGVEVTFACTDPDGAGMSGDQIEITVQPGGALEVDGATFRGVTPTESCWFGLVYLPGSGGHLNESLLRDAIIPVVLGASIRVTDNIITQIYGTPGTESDPDGGSAMGIAIMTGDPLIAGNTIFDLRGGDGRPSTVPGQNGGQGGFATGIHVGGGNPLLIGNRIEGLTGGAGGAGFPGAEGTPGINGVDGDPVGGNGGPGSNGSHGGDGGFVRGINFTSDSTGIEAPQITSNVIMDLVAGPGARGGDAGVGGVGGNGFDSIGGRGGAGGAGGQGGTGGSGGSAKGIEIRSAPQLIVRMNTIMNLTSGTGGFGGYGGNGGDGGNGGNLTTDNPAPDGGAGGPGGAGGVAGMGGDVVFVDADETAGETAFIFAQNYLQGGYSREGGNGGQGGTGGHGGHGGNVTAANVGGNGGNGGDGGLGGFGLQAGVAIGLSLNQENDDPIVNNIVASFYTWDSGKTGNSGAGGMGGDGGSGAGGSLPGAGGNGGRGGDGIAGLDGRDASLIAVRNFSSTLINNTLSVANAGRFGMYGSAGLGGAGGSGDPVGLPGDNGLPITFFGDNGHGAAIAI